MNMQSAILSRDISDNVDPKSDWNAAIARYKQLRNISDQIDVADDERSDEAIDAYCDAMDHIVDDVPAPDLAAVITKLELMHERTAPGFSISDNSYQAIIDDLRRLAALTQARTLSNSLILQLHQRYEEIWDACDRVDVAQPPKDQPGTAKAYFACERAMGELSAESLLVQKLLLRQIPSTDEEMTVQIMHLASLYEAEQPLSMGEQQAIEIGVSHCFDYLVSEGRADMEAMGRQFSNCALIKFDERRYRQGILDD